MIIAFLLQGMGLLASMRRLSYHRDNYRVLGAPLVDGAFAPIAGGVETLFPIQIPACRKTL